MHTPFPPIPFAPVAASSSPAGGHLPGVEPLPDPVARPQEGGHSTNEYAECTYRKAGTDSTEDTGTRVPVAAGIAGQGRPAPGTGVSGESQLEIGDSVMVSESHSYAPQRLGRSTRAVPPAALTPHVPTLSDRIADALREADGNAGVLLSMFVRRHKSAPTDDKAIAYAETCRAQGYADGLRRAQVLEAQS